jgi:hypothetical protein
MFVLGLLVLLAVGGLAVSRIIAGDGGAQSPGGSGLLGYHVHGPGSQLFFFGLVLAAAATQGLAAVIARLGKPSR